MNISAFPPISNNVLPGLDIGSLNINDFDDQEEIYEDLYQDLKDTIYSTLDNRTPNDKKDELIDSLFALVIRDMKFDNQDCIQYPISYNLQNTNNQCFNTNFNPMFPLYNFNLPNYSFPQQLNPMQPILQYPPYVHPQVPSLPYQMPNPLLQSPQLPLQYQSLYYPYSNKIADDHSQEKDSKHKKHESHSKSKKNKDKKKHDKKNRKEKGKKDKKKGKNDEKDKIIQSFPYSEGTNFNGIIRYLTSKTGGNIHNNSTIEITTNSNLSNRPTAPSLIDYDSRNDYMAKSGDFYAWVCFDFKNMEIEVTNYTIKSSHCLIGHLRSWVLEISNDNSNWKTIDEHKDDSSLNGPNLTRTFSTQKSKFSRYCRFRHTGEYWGYKPSGTSIEFNSLEFYGKLKTSS